MESKKQFTTYRHKAMRMTMVILLSFSPLSCGSDPGAVAEEKKTGTEQVQLLEDIRYLSADALEGRETGTEGNRMAQHYIEVRFDSLGLKKFGESYRHSFEYQPNGGEQVEAVNLIGFVPGTAGRERYLVMTAHYDHLGNQNGEIYNGADDNASGTAALLEAARYFSENPLQHNVVLIAFDAEEKGLRGARHFVEEPAVPLDEVVININMDMISTNFENELYAVGTSHYPFLKPLIEEAVADAPVNILFGYDTPEAPQDWTGASDHGPFHQKGVPFIYFGVEDHPGYHQPSDDYETINPEFYQNATETILRVVEYLDSTLETVEEASGRF